MNIFPEGPIILPMTIAYKPICDPKFNTLLPGLTMIPITLIKCGSHVPKFLMACETVPSMESIMMLNPYCVFTSYSPSSIFTNVVVRFYLLLTKEEFPQ
jgi:hypothetical protein